MTVYDKNPAEYNIAVANKDQAQAEYIHEKSDNDDPEGKKVDPIE